MDAKTTKRVTNPATKYVTQERDVTPGDRKIGRKLCYVFGGRVSKYLIAEAAIGQMNGEIGKPLIPDSPDEMTFGQLRAPISIVRSSLYAGSSSRILTDPTGERSNRQFRQRFCGLRSCRPNPSGESGLT